MAIFVANVLNLTVMNKEKLYLCQLKIINIGKYLYIYA